MAELVDALDLGSSALACMGVQLPPLAPGEMKFSATAVLRNKIEAFNYK